MQMAASFLCICACLLASIIMGGHQTTALQSEKDALLRLKEGFGNPRSLVSWNLTVNVSPCKSWVGIICDINSSSVIGLSLTGFRDLAGRRISPDIADLHHLRSIELPNNGLIGTIPPGITNLSCLEHLDISGNALTGALPLLWGNLSRLVILNLSDNRISGTIPTGLVGAINLRVLRLENNHLSGHIPDSIVDLVPTLITFNVSYNHLVGQIPRGFSKKFNDYSAFEGNPFLCGKPLRMACATAMAQTLPQQDDTRNPMNRDPNRPSPGKRRSSHKGPIIIASVLGGTAFLLGLMILCIVFSRRRRHTEANGGGATRQVQNWFSPDIQADRRRGTYKVFSRGFNYSYDELVTNAGYFDTAHVIGKGRYATVYKSQLPDGTLVAVKVFKFSNVGLCYEKDMELLASIKHRNLLAIKGFYANPVEKAIFYNYVANGTLYDVFHGPKISRDTRDDVLPDWALRQKIALGIAQAMAYLHRGCGYKILHRDLKSTNILLDADYNPRVSDFGLIHLVSGRAEPVETLGYTAPEVLSGKKHTEKGDVYSYGVVLLELLTGQRAVAYIGERAVKLAEWVMRLHDEGRGREVFDPIVVGTCQLPEQLDRYLNLAVLCIDVNPSNRPSMAEIANILETQCSSASPLRSPDCKANNPLLSG